MEKARQFHKLGLPHGGNLLIWALQAIPFGQLHLHALLLLHCQFGLSHVPPLDPIDPFESIGLASHPPSPLPPRIRSQPCLDMAEG